MIRLQSSRFSKIQKFVPLIFSHCEPILNIIRVSNSCVYQKTLPAVFEKKRLSLSLLGLSELILKVENGHTVQQPAPPVLRRAGAPGLTLKNFLTHKKFLILQKISNQQILKPEKFFNLKKF